MSAVRHEALQRLFTEACSLDPADRERFLDDACAGDPDVRREVEALLAADAEAIAPVDAGGEGARFLAGALAESGEIEAPVTRHPDRLGKYRIVRVISEGGMGIVYEAEQDDPQRHVALKVVRSAIVTRELLRRFRHEAQVLGLLRHPGIAQIYEAGTADAGEGGQPFFAMELVEGETLTAYADAQGLDTAARLELIARLCDILHYAHQKGVIHRDLKPANIMVTTEASSPSSSSGSARGTVLAPLPALKILDFGVARATDSDLQTVTLQTSVGDLVGTVPYMSPEQASGDPGEIDIRSDVYAVGVIAYELLTGRLPYEVRGKLVHEAVRVIREEDPTSLSAVDRGLRGDVDTIIAKALEKDKARRYQSAADLAADIRRHLGHQPIEARPASTVYQIHKFARRHKVLVGGVAATLFVAIIGAAVATRFAVVATQRLSDLQDTSYMLGMTAASDALERREFDEAERYLKGTSQDHRGWEYEHLRARLVQFSEAWEAPAPLVTTPVFDSAGTRMFAAMSDGGRVSIGTWDATTGQLLRTQPIDGVVDHRQRTVVLHGPSLQFAAIAADGGILVGGLEPGAPAFVIAESRAEASAVEVYAWDRAGRQLLYVSRIPEEDGDVGETTSVWDGTRSRVVSDRRSSRGAFDTAGERVALADGGWIWLFDAVTGDQLAEREIDGAVTALAFAPDDATLATAGLYGTAHLLDGRTLEGRSRLSGHKGWVYGVTWSEDGSRLITTGEDGTARVWNAHMPGVPRVLDANTEGQVPASITPDGEYVVIAGASTQRFPLRDPSVLRGHASYVYYLAFSPDGSTLASSGWVEDELFVWDVRRARLLRTLPAPRTSPQAAGDGAEVFAVLAFADDGRGLVADSGVETVHWDVESGAALPVSPNADRSARFLETIGASRSLYQLRPGVDFTRDGERLVWCQNDRVPLYASNHRVPMDQWAHGKLEDLFDLTRPVGHLEGHVGAVMSAAFSPDGTRIATGGRDTTVRIWDARTCEQLLVLRGHEDYVMHVQFSPDGTLLASASGDYTIRLWDTLPLHERRATGGQQ